MASPIQAAALAFFADFDPGLSSVAERLVAGGVARVLPKGYTLVEAGTVVDRFYYQHRGVTCHSVQRGRHRMATWLTIDGGLVTALASLTSGAPTPETIEAVEETHVIEFAAADLRRAYREIPGAERLGRLVVEHYFERLTGRLYANTVMTARDRYVALLDSTPEVLMRVPLGIVAGYLGMTQETLSRVRRSLAKG